MLRESLSPHPLHECDMVAAHVMDGLMRGVLSPGVSHLEPAYGLLVPKLP